MPSLCQELTCSDENEFLEGEQPILEVSAFELSTMYEGLIEENVQKEKLEKDHRVRRCPGEGRPFNLLLHPVYIHESMWTEQRSAVEWITSEESAF